MIRSINLSSPRKSAQSIINNMLFERKIKKINLSKHKKLSMMFFIYLLINARCVMAKEANTPNHIINLYSYFINFFQAIGYPTIDVIFNCIRFHKPFYDYIKYMK